MRRVLLKLHLYVAFVGGIFVIILGATGSIMAFEQEIDELFHPSLYNVHPGAGNSLTISEIGDTLNKKYPGSNMAAFIYPDRPDHSCSVILPDRGAVYVDEYTGEVLGERTEAGLLDYIHQFHIRLLAGKTGEDVMGGAGIAMLFLVISGIILWWKYKQFSIRFDGTLVRAMFDVHTVTGAYTSVVLLFLSVTGIVIANDQSIFPWLYARTNSKPIPRFMPSTPRADVVPISAQQAVAVAQSALPEASPLMVVMPQGPKGSYNVRLHFPEDRTPGGRSWAIVDQYTGNLLVVQNSRTAPAPTRAEILNRAIHTGDIFGTLSKVLFSLSSALIVVQAVTGYVLWWKRDRKKRR